MNSELRVVGGLVLGCAGIIAIGCTVAYSVNGRAAFQDPPSKADVTYAQELKKENTPVHDSRVLGNFTRSDALSYWCIDGYVYVQVNRGVAPYISNLTSRPNGFTACKDFK